MESEEQKARNRARAKKWYWEHREIAREYHRKRYIGRRDEFCERAKKWRTNNAERARTNGQKWLSKNQDRHKELARRWYSDHRQKSLENVNAWGKKNPEKVREYKRKWESTHREYCSKKAKEWQAAQMATNPSFRLKNALRSRVTKILSATNKSASTMKLVGCSIDKLWTHLESKFKPGMTRENYGKVWHVDHIIPLASFGKAIENKNVQRIAFHWSNLQPLFAKENQRKSDRMPDGSTGRLETICRVSA